jgi:magnesium chelatase family protein
LDEWPEFHRDVLESLRQPIENGQITILRAKHSITFPARFTLIAASNPCPCGYYGQPERECHCTNSQIRMYKRKLSGPLMDRIDLFISLSQLKYEKLTMPDLENCSKKIRERVKKARKIQRERFQTTSQSLNQSKEFLTNSEMTLSQIKKYCQIDLAGQNLLRKFVDSGKLSARGYHRVLKVARTIADLENSEKILLNHLSEALSYRLPEENGWS